MPRHFNISKFRTFVRKLERWGFTQIKDPTKTDDHLKFFHPLFRRDQQDELLKISPRSLSRRSSIALPSSTNTMNEGPPQRIETLKAPRRSSTGSGLGNIQVAINRNLDLSNNLQQRMQVLCNERDCPSLDLKRVSLGYDNPSFQSVSLSQTEVNNATKNVVAAAIQCLMHDEHHTLNLLARRGHELKRASLITGSQGMAFESSL